MSDTDGDIRYVEPARGFKTHAPTNDLAEATAWAAAMAHEREHDDWVLEQLVDGQWTTVADPRVDDPGGA